MTRLALLAVLLMGTTAAADLTKVERKIRKEPAYATKSQSYALLVFGPAATDRVWLVRDGDTLYVDRNGNGDLTDPGEKVAAKKGSSPENGLTFEIDDLVLNGVKHHDLSVGVSPVKRWLYNDYAKMPELLAAVKKDPLADTLLVTVRATMPHLRAKGPVLFLAGPVGLDGPLAMSPKAADAPVVHLGGPLSVTFYGMRPTLRRQRPSELVFVVGTPGLGAGTFSMVGYDETIPATSFPKGEMTFSPAKAGGVPVKKTFEFKERC